MNSRQQKLDAIKFRQSKILGFKAQIRPMNKQIALIKNHVKETQNYLDAVKAHQKDLIEHEHFVVAKQFDKIKIKHQKEIDGFEEVLATLILTRRPLCEWCIILRDEIRRLKIDIAQIDATETKLKGIV